MDCDGDFFDTTHFPPHLKQYPLQGSGIYFIEGKVVQEFDFPSIEVIRVAKLPIKADPRNG